MHAWPVIRLAAALKKKAYCTSSAVAPASASGSRTASSASERSVRSACLPKVVIAVPAM